MKKIIALVLVIALCCTLSVGLTLAYLTDRDSKANVFTVGDVGIDLNEDFTQGSELIPGVKIEKEPTITNTGKNDAWVFATVAVPQELAGVVKFDGRGADWADWTGPETANIDGKTYSLYTALYNESLAKGDETTALFETVTLNETVDITPEGQWYTVVDGTATDLNWNNTNGNPVVHVSAYAIQKNEFATVEAAYEAYMGQWGDNGTEYDTPANVTEVSNAAELAAALANGGIAFLTEDVDMTEIGSHGLEVAPGTDITIHGNGNTIKLDHTAFNNTTIGNEGIKSGNLTFKEVVFTSENHGSSYVVCTGFDYTDSVRFVDCTFDGLYTAIYMNQNTSGTPSNLSIENCEYKNTAWGYGIDTYTSMAAGNMIPYNEQVNVTFIGNTGIAAACERESTWEADAPTIYRPADNAAVKEAVKDAASGATIVLPADEISLPNLSAKEGVTIVGTEGTVVGGEGATTGYGGNFGKNTTIQNITFSGSDHGVRYSYAKGGVSTFDNCTFAGDSTYGFHIDQSNGATFIFNNCTFVGFNAFASDLEKVVFNNCTFLSNGNYGHTNIWSVAEFNNCTWGENTSYGTRGDGVIYIDGNVAE